jgi:hypothetical protein
LDLEVCEQSNVVADVVEGSVACDASAVLVHQELCNVFCAVERLGEYEGVLWEGGFVGEDLEHQLEEL